MSIIENTFNIKKLVVIFQNSFEKIIKAIRYKYSTIKQLSELLEANVIDNNCIDTLKSLIKIQ